MAIAAPLLFVAWLFVVLWVYLGNGGNFGGYGAAPADAHGWWILPFQVGVTLVAVGLNLAIGFWVYRRVR